MMYPWTKLILTSLITMMSLLSLISTLEASMLSNISVANSPHKATILISFNGPPNYTFFSLKAPERIVLDIKQKDKVISMPLTFSSQSLVRSIRFSRRTDTKNVRLVFNLTQHAKIHISAYERHGRNILQFTLLTETSDNLTVMRKATKVTRVVIHSLQTNSANPLTKKPTIMPGITRRVTTTSRRMPVGCSDRVLVAIDAGHGGQDPGAIGPDGLKEKNITIAIARRLQVLLNNDPQFKPVLTHNGDYFISVIGRSDVARKQGANVLVSIHADAAPNRNANGASVWVLSNRRANSEMAGWLEQHEKQSELLGGAGDVLANSQTDPYLTQAVLDLQFGHSQRVGYEIALKVLEQLQRIGSLHKSRPEHASLGVLRSPDIPSLLIETGFISNSKEERLLGSSSYQEKIAEAIYNGLHDYFSVHPLQADLKRITRPLLNMTNTNSRICSHCQIHLVKHSETLSNIANNYSTNIATFSKLNKLSRNYIWTNKPLKVPAKRTIVNINSVIKVKQQAQRAITYKVTYGDTLLSIAARYNISLNALRRINKLKSDVVLLNQTLTIPQA